MKSNQGPKRKAPKNMKIAISIVVILSGIFSFSNIESLKGSDESGKKSSATSGIVGGNEDKSHLITPDTSSPFTTDDNRQFASSVGSLIYRILETRNDKAHTDYLIYKIKYQFDPASKKNYVPYENIKPKTAIPESPKK